MKRVQGKVRKALELYNMIDAGDKIAVGLSGGKDSLTLLDALASLKNYYPVPFDLVAITVDMHNGESDFSKITEFCEKRGVEHKIVPSQIYDILFKIRKEPNPCSLCARLRRAILAETAKKLGCNKVALGHHADDLIETAVMNLIRGTGWRGLTPMSQNQIARPLLSWTKTDITQYAIEHNLSWVEDSTNDSMSYFRNRIRGVIGAWARDEKGQFLQLITKQVDLRCQIDSEIDSYINKHIESDGDSLVIRRYNLIMLPNDVAIEILKRLTESKLTTGQLWQLLIFIKSAKPAKKIAWKTVDVVVSQGSATLSVGRH